MGMNLPKWSFTLLLIALATFAFADGNGMNSYTAGWSETHPTDADAYWGVSGPYDFDGDGFPEILVYSDDGGITPHLYENMGDDAWEEVWSTTITEVSYSYEACDQTPDLDGDGIPELLIAGEGGSSGTYASLFIFELDTAAVAQGGISFLPVAVVNPAEIGGFDNGEGAYPTSTKTIIANDLDGDSITELLLYDGRSHNVMVMSLDTNSTYDFPNWIVEFTDNSFCCSAYGGVVGDFDANGTNNFALVEWDYNGISFFDVLGPDDYELIQFTDDITIYDGGSLRSLDAADIDGDGYTEIILASTSGDVLLYSIGADLADFDATTDVYEIFSSADFNGIGFNGAQLGNPDIWRSPSDGMDYVISTDSTAIIDLEYDGMGDVTDAASWTAYVLETSDMYDNTWQDVALGDFDFDGLDEIYAVTTAGPLSAIFEHAGWDKIPSTITPVFAEEGVNPGYQTRGVAAGSDLDNDGLKEIIITDYQVHGVHVYEVTGDNTLEWVATMRDDSTSYGSTPRHVTTGDLDNNGRGEIIYLGMRDLGQAYNGINVWEWDGVDGSDTYTRYVVPILLNGVEVDRYYAERGLVVGDVDGDGQEELLITNNGAANESDVFIIGSIQGTFSGGFYDLVHEYENIRTVTGDFNGSPWAGGNYGDLDGDGDMEAIFIAWNSAQMLVVESTGANEYELQTVVTLDSAFTDKTPYGTSFVGDLDGDGADEYYIGLYSPGWLLQVKGGDDVADISYENGNITMISDFGAVWVVTGGNVDDDPEPEVFSVDYTHGRIYQWDYNGQGFDMGVVANWDATMGGFALDYAGDMDGDGYPELVQGFLEPPGSAGNLYGYTFAVAEIGGVTGTDNNWTVITPDDYKLNQNYPNPFNPSTTIEFTLPLAKDNISVIVYNMLGQEVVRLADHASYGPGTHSVTWNSLKADGSPAAAGVYIYELRSGNVSKTAKMTLVK
jgi:hypothetical protein